MQKAGLNKVGLQVCFTMLGHIVHILLITPLFTYRSSLLHSFPTLLYFMPYMISQTVIADDAVDAMISQLAALALSNQTAQNLATLAQLFFQLGDLATNGNVTFKEEVKTLLSNGIFS